MKKHLALYTALTLIGWIGFPYQIWGARITETRAAIGEGCVASGEHSTAMGGFTLADGYSSTAMGESTSAKGRYSVAMGDSTNANGDHSIAMGHYTTASGDYSTAMGHYTTASGKYSTIIGTGYYQDELTNDIERSFMIGYMKDRYDTLPEFLVKEGGVGIGTKVPNEPLEVGGIGRAFFGDGGGSLRKGLLIDGIDGDNAARIEAYDYGANKGLHLVLNTVGDGNVGIGRVPSVYKLEVEGDALKTAGGNTWKTSSDERLKDIAGEYSQGLNEIVRLRPVTFYYKKDNPRGLPSEDENIGFIAQEVQEVFPEAVSEGPDGYLDFNMHPVNVALVNAVKELKAENEALREEIRQIKTALGM